MPPADVMDNLLVPRVIYSNGYTSFSFIRTVSSVDTTQDIDLSRPKFFVYALNGAATFNADGSIASVRQHLTTPIISTERVTLGTAAQCPGKERERERRLCITYIFLGTFDELNTGPGPTDGSGTVMVSVLVLIFCTLLAYFI